MNGHNEIKNAYCDLGKEASFYDGMITCSTLPGRAVCGLVWNMGREKNTRYLEKALSGIPDGFAGKLLEVPVGTGVLTMPVYKTLPRADITCLDYSPDMMAAARRRGLPMCGFSRVMSGSCLSRMAISIWCCPSTAFMLSPTRKQHTGKYIGFSVQAGYSAAVSM